MPVTFHPKNRRDPSGAGTPRLGERTSSMLWMRLDRSSGIGLGAYFAMVSGEMLDAPRPEYGASASAEDASVTARTSAAQRGSFMIGPLGVTGMGERRTSAGKATALRSRATIVNSRAPAGNRGRTPSGPS